MSADRDARAKEVLDGALDLRGTARSAFIERECGGDGALRSRVEALLDGAEREDGFLAGVTENAVPEPPAEEAGSRIGPYKLLQAIGEGGFGRVYMAEQERPVRRRVALKIIKLGMDTRAVVARFEQERQALALMDHPNIAKVLDAGATQSGRPYFVMELVKGDPITAYCDRNSLSIPERLGLFVQVCQALQHAHTKGIIHRDIKPSNVLVATQDGKPHARVIDFGIAKATQHRLTDKTVFTEFRQLIGTLEYMSPEQAEGSLDVDTRTDVYSLGVLLYELLTGATPFDPSTLRLAAYAEMQRIIREEEPPRPSTRLAQSAEKLPSVAAQRKIEPRKLGLIMRGELDWVVMKALEKERARRYETPSGLAEDITRFLQGDAVMAAPPSVRYRFQKFVRRNRGVVIAGALVLGALVLGVIGTSIGLVKAQRARWEEKQQAVIARASAAKAVEEAARADKEATAAKKQAQIARSANEFLTDMLSRADRGEQGGNPDVRVREVLDAAAASLSVTKAGYEPEVYEGVLRTLGRTYGAIGLYPEARRNLEEALKLREARLGPESLEVAESLSDLVSLNIGQEQASDAQAERALTIRRKVLGPDHQLVAASISNLALLKWQRRDYAGAQTLHEESLAILRRCPGDVKEDIASALDSLGLVLSAKGDARGAVTRHREALALRKEVFGEENRAVATSLNNLGWALLNDGHAQEAEECYRSALAMRIKLIGREHAVTALTMNNLAGVLQAEGKSAEAEGLLREALEIRSKVLGPEERITIGSIENLASCLHDEKKLDEAEALYRESLALRKRVLGADDPDVADTLGNLAVLMRDRGDLDSAEKMLREALEIRRKREGDHPDTALSLSSLAVILATKGDFAGAIPLAEEAVAIRRRLTGPSNHEVAKALFNLGQMQQASGDYAASEPTLRETLEQFREFFGPEDGRTLAAAASLGATLAELEWKRLETGGAGGGAERADEAESLLRTALKSVPAGAGAADVQLAVRRGQLAGAIAAVEAGRGDKVAAARLSEAESLLNQAYSVLNSAANPAETAMGQRRLRDARVRFVRLYTVWERVQPGMGAKADAYREKARGDRGSGLDARWRYG